MPVQKDAPYPNLTDEFAPVKPDLKDNICSICLFALALALLWLLLYGC